MIATSKRLVPPFESPRKTYTLSLYESLGVDVKKRGIESFKGSLDNLFPNAFCVVQRDPSDPGTGIVCHTDSAGTKPIQAYLMYRETGEAGWFRGLAQDALAMNVNDILCVGARPVTFVDYVAFNTLNIDRVELLAALAEGFAHCKRVLTDEGVPLMFAGGETADLPDLLRTLDVSVAIFGKVPLNKVITGERIKPGDVIIGLRSGGGVRYEEGVNSGVMSNGHTLARNSLLMRSYLEKYPELSHPGHGRFTGRFKVDDYVDELGMTVGEALLSPTRLYAPIAAAVLSKVGRDVHGMVHNTGGGQTKCLRLGKGIHYVKDSLPEPDPIFALIEAEAKVDPGEMYQDFNMGVGFEFVVEPSAVDDVLKVSEGYGLGVQVIGRCEESREGNALTIKHAKETHHYR
jgi:phosphoribosylformylglycinamidine cyclo-ligase